jgi:hypothetical protein
MFSLLTDAPVILLGAEKAMHEKDGWTITGANDWRLVELVCKRNDLSGSRCREAPSCEQSGSRVVAHSNVRGEAPFRVYGACVAQCGKGEAASLLIPLGTRVRMATNFNTGMAWQFSPI